jgi:hypothetical protein
MGAEMVQGRFREGTGKVQGRYPTKGGGLHGSRDLPRPGARACRRRTCHIRRAPAVVMCNLRTFPGLSGRVPAVISPPRRMTTSTSPNRRRVTPTSVTPTCTPEPALSIYAEFEDDTNSHLNSTIEDRGGKRRAAGSGRAEQPRGGICGKEPAVLCKPRRDHKQASPRL